MIKLGNILQYLKSDWLIWFTPSDTSSLAKKGSVIEEQFLIMLVQNKTRLFAGVVRPGAHLGGLFGCHDRPLCTAGRLLSIKADDEIWNAVTAGLYGGWFGTGNSLHFPSESRIQRYANKEVATISPPFHNIPHRSHVLFAWHSFHILITVPFCCDQKAQAANALSFTLWQQATIEITCHDHCIIACSHHIYMGVVLRAHPVRGESRIQHNANGEVATTSPPFYNKPHRSQVLFAKSALGTTFSSWSQHHFVVIGRPKRQTCKASHCGGKQQ